MTMYYSIRLVGPLGDVFMSEDYDYYICKGKIPAGFSYSCRYENALKYISREVALAAIDVLRPEIDLEFPGVRKMNWVAGEYRECPGSPWTYPDSVFGKKFTNDIREKFAIKAHTLFTK